MRRFVKVFLLVLVSGMLALPTGTSAETKLEKPISVSYQRYDKEIKFWATVNTEKNELIFIGAGIPTNYPDELPHLHIRPQSSFHGKIFLHTAITRLVFDKGARIEDCLTAGFLLQSRDEQKFTLHFSILYHEVEKLQKLGINKIYILVTKNGNVVGLYPIAMPSILEGLKKL